MTALVTRFGDLDLVLTEGYASTAGEALVRTELSDEAVRLARILHRPTWSGGWPRWSPEGPSSPQPRHGCSATLRA